MPKSVMVHQFAQVPRANIPRSSFNRSHGVKTTIPRAGKLYPIFVDEALPGDTFNVRMTAFGRMATPIHPIMDNMFMETFFFAVPIRLIWDNWVLFNGEQKNPGDSIDYTVPQMVDVIVREGDLGDYMGLPTETPSAITFNSLHHRAYNLIWNEWFRDQNLQTQIAVPTGDAGDSYNTYFPRDRGKRHDYFTSCLPWPQKGDTVLLPLGLRADVKGIGLEQPTPTNNVTGNLVETGSTQSGVTLQPTSVEVRIKSSGATTSSHVPDVYADLSNATAATINEIRQAFQIQKMQERDARGGTRYTEIIRSHFGVVSPDQRLQRPEYLGGGSSMVNINPVAQTSETATDSNTPQGNLAAYGTVSAQGHGFTRSFTEHCVLIGLVNFRADLTYQQGINRMFSRRTRYDYYWPALAHIGEQAVLNKEIYATGDGQQDNQVFGYQERYAEYRFKPSQICGKFRGSVAQSLDTWHLSQYFTQLPQLNADFISDKPPVDRVIAVQEEPHFLLDAYFNMKCARPMPVYGVPGLVDHF